MFVFLITFSTREYNIDPYPHGFRRWRHQIIEAFVCLHYKRQIGIRRFDGVQVIQVHFFDGLRNFQNKINALHKKSSDIVYLEVRSAPRFLFCFIRIVDEGVFISVEDEPSSRPPVQFRAFLVEETPARGGVDDDMRAKHHLVSCKIKEPI